MIGQKKNQRRLFVRDCIVSALIELLESKSLSSVTITELTAKAGVSRMAYYRNYKTKEDIVVQYLADVFQAYHADISCWDNHGCYHDYKNLTHCFNYFKQYNLFLKVLFKRGMGDMFFNALRDYLIRIYCSDVNDSKPFYRIHAFAGSLYSVCITWIMDDMRKAPEDIAQIVFDIYR